MKKNSKISQFLSFLLRSGYAILVKIWKWLKLLNSVRFIKKTLANQVYIRISSFWLTFTVLKWLKTNLKISQFSRFLLRSMYVIPVKILKWLKLLNSVPFIKKTLVNHVYIRISSFLLTFTGATVNEEKLQNYSIFRISPKVQICNSGQNLKMTKTSKFCSIHQENTCKSALHSNLIILTDFHSFTVNKHKLQN